MDSKVHFKGYVVFLRCGTADLDLSVGQRLGVGDVGKSLVEGVVQFEGE